MAYMLAIFIVTRRDSGIGMSREQLLSNLGTIARSGTRKFMEMMKEQAKGGSSDNNLIGQVCVSCRGWLMVP